jgi:hypothetical protein
VFGPRWGATRIRLEPLRNHSEVAVPSERTVNRIVARQGLLVERPQKRRLVSALGTARADAALESTSSAG